MAGNIYRRRAGKTLSRSGIGDGPGQDRAVVAHVHIEDVSVVQIDTGGHEIDGWNRGRSAVGVHARRVAALAQSVGQIKLHRHTVGNASGHAAIS